MIHITLIDDDPIFHKLMGCILRTWPQEEDYKLTSCFSGMDALKSLKDSSCDIIFLDFNMPGLNGLEVAEILQQDAALCHIPVIMITSETELDVEDCLNRLGMHALLRKPPDSMLLYKTVQKTFCISPVIQRV